MYTDKFTKNKIVAKPGNTDLIYIKKIKYTYGRYILFCMCYPKSVCFIEFLMDFCTYDDILDTIQIKDKNFTL